MKIIYYKIKINHQMRFIILIKMEIENSNDYIEKDQENDLI